MHVLPLPFGLALALIPRREAEKLRTRKPVPEPVPAHVSLDKTKDCRDQILGSHYFIAGRFPF
jgi:hypothetical protein